MTCMTIGPMMNPHINILASRSSFDSVHERLERLNLDYEQETPELMNTSLRSNTNTSGSSSCMEIADESIIDQVRREVTKLL
jgi:hypothetical protein